MLEIKLRKVAYVQWDMAQKWLSIVKWYKNFSWLEMKVTIVIFLSSLIAVITENIAAKYLLVEMDQTKDVGMFLTFLA